MACQDSSPLTLVSMMSFVRISGDESTTRNKGASVSLKGPIDRVFFNSSLLDTWPRSWVSYSWNISYRSPIYTCWDMILEDTVTWVLPSSTKFTCNKLILLLGTHTE